MEIGRNECDPEKMYKHRNDLSSSLLTTSNNDGLIFFSGEFSEAADRMENEFRFVPRSLPQGQHAASAKYVSAMNIAREVK